MLKTTPLYQHHLALRAKMFNFHGWSVPLHYGSQLEEHHAVRHHAAVFDVSHMSIYDISGEQAEDFLRYILTNDVARLPKQKALYSCLVNPQGGVLDDVIAYRCDTNSFRLIGNAVTRPKLSHWLAQYAKKFAVSIKYRDDLAILALQGPDACRILTEIMPSAHKTKIEQLPPFHYCQIAHFFISRTGYTGEDGFEIIVPEKEVGNLWQTFLHNKVSVAGLGARDTLRLEAGMCLYGEDIDDSITPLDAGLTKTLSFKDENRRFIGRSVLEYYYKNSEHLITVGLILLDKGILRPQHKIQVGEKIEGVITSGAYSPTLGISIALARIPAGIYDKVSVLIRNKPRVAQVVKPPFVHHGKVCVNFTKL